MSGTSPAIDGSPASSRRLILLRHAKSDWPDVADHNRPLAKRGRHDAPLVGRWLGESGFVPDAVVCSTALRARQTWELAAGGLLAVAPHASPAVRYEPRVYEATVLSLLMLVREFPPAWQAVLIVGHNPGLAELTAALPAPRMSPPPLDPLGPPPLGKPPLDKPPLGPPPSFPTAAVAVLSLSGDWSAAAPGEGRLLCFRPPR